MFGKKKKIDVEQEEQLIEPTIEKVSISDINKEIEDAEAEVSKNALREIIKAFLALSKEEKRIAVDRILKGKI